MWVGENYNRHTRTHAQTHINITHVGERVQDERRQGDILFRGRRCASMGHTRELNILELRASGAHARAYAAPILSYYICVGIVYIRSQSCGLVGACVRRNVRANVCKTQLHACPCQRSGPQHDNCDDCGGASTAL